MNIIDYRFRFSIPALVLLLSTLNPPLSTVFAQGPLNPPGAPTPTMKTLQQVEPRTDLKVLYDQNHDGAGDDNNYELVITQPGAYYLSSNMGPDSPMPVTRTNAIRVTVVGVNIDLNGFQIKRTSGSGGDGITIINDGCTVRNGFISNFGYGVRCPGFEIGGSFLQLIVTFSSNVGLVAGEGWQIDGCKTYFNYGTGIAAGIGSTLTNCTARTNGNGDPTSSGISTLAGCTLTNCTAYNHVGTSGISTGSGCALTNCSAYNSSGTGISVQDGCTLVNCSAYNNSGMSGISALGGCTLTNCSAYFNQGTYAIRATTGSTLSNCTAYNNQDTYGIHVAGSTLSNCAVYNNQVTYGIFAIAGCTLNNCMANFNHEGGTSSYGIYAVSRCSLTACAAGDNGNSNASASNNTGVGIYAGDGTTIQHATVQGNKGDGIQVTSNCVVADNNCDGNGTGAGLGFGINASGSDNRIQRNSATHNDKGIYVAGTGNLIDGNHVRDSLGPGIEVTTANGKNVIIRNEAGNNGGSYSSVAAGNQMAPTGDPTTATNPFLNILN